MDYSQKLSEQFSVRADYVANIIALLDEGNTIPFIARYRKEMHGSMDDQLIREISERLSYLRGLDERREEVRTLIEAQEKLTDEISLALDAAKTLSEIEDIYRPFRPKRKTRASVAKEKGLEPLAQLIFAQEDQSLIPIVAAERYIDEEKRVLTAEEALQGALDIIAEDISDNAEIRKRIRNLTMMGGIISSVAAKEDTDSVYSMYYEFSEAVSKIAGHRVLAIDRGEKEGFLKVSVNVDSEKMLSVIDRLVVKGNSPCSSAVKGAGEDSFSRLIFPSIEREVRNELTDRAAEQAIKVFGTNLHQLLMQPPVKGKIAIGLDPGYRTGCKLAVVDETGRVLDTSVIYPTHSDAQIEKSKAILKQMIKKHKAQIIAIGNGTASKETEMFTAQVIGEIDDNVSYMVVSEAGASVYSASKLAAAELPDFDLTLRSAVSIARRLQDPLAELVKIDPKAIGVGQYQHDVDQNKLKEALDFTVMSCVNTVGVNVNTASRQLLSYVSGIGPQLAGNIVEYRAENGDFTSRRQLLKVPRMGEKAFQQCAGFLRIPGAENILDNTAVHPESYGVIESIARDNKCGVDALIADKSLLKSIDLCRYVTDKVGLPTLNDI
ncbi:MAG: Tex family protein, partial [Oscillospiraceae bacterium]|nr:Tex family protein [Oscillospiraceae bacterium]